MMFLFLRDDSAKRIGRLLVDALKRLQLLMHMAKHDAFDRDRCGGDRIAPSQPGQEPQGESTNRT